MIPKLPSAPFVNRTCPKRPELPVCLGETTNESYGSVNFAYWSPLTYASACATSMTRSASMGLKTSKSISTSLVKIVPREMYTLMCVMRVGLLRPVMALEIWMPSRAVARDSCGVLWVSPSMVTASGPSVVMNSFRKSWVGSASVQECMGAGTYHGLRVVGVIGHVAELGWVRVFPWLEIERLKG